MACMSKKQCIDEFTSWKGELSLFDPMQLVNNPETHNIFNIYSEKVCTALLQLSQQPAMKFMMSHREECSRYLSIRDLLRGAEQALKSNHSGQLRDKLQMVERRFQEVLGYLSAAMPHPNKNLECGPSGGHLMTCGGVPLANLLDADKVPNFVFAIVHVITGLGRIRMA